jgi:hypothetical protein
LHTAARRGQRQHFSFFSLFVHSFFDNFCALSIELAFFFVMLLLLLHIFPLKLHISSDFGWRELGAIASGFG